jgi:hypothetical protein
LEGKIFKLGFWHTILFITVMPVCRGLIFDKKIIVLWRHSFPLKFRYVAF